MKFDFHQTSSLPSSNVSFVLRCEQQCCIRSVHSFGHHIQQCCNRASAAAIGIHGGGLFVASVSHVAISVQATEW